MNEQKYTFSDFVATLEEHFSKYVNGGNSTATDGEYTQGVFDDFMRAIVGDKTDDPEIAAENPNKPNLNVQIYDSGCDVVCYLFNRPLTHADFVVINTALNLIMLLVSIVILKQRKGL